MTHKGGCVYIITNNNNTTLYTGVTSDLSGRLWEHKTKAYPRSFSSRYNLTKLVYYDCYDSIESAIDREKVIKGKSRVYKETLIDAINPSWKDLSSDIEDW